MEPTKIPNITLTHAKSRVIRDILTPLQDIMTKANSNQNTTKDDIFLNITLPLLTHICPSLTEIVSMAFLWRQIQEMIWLKCITDGQWREMEDYVVLMVKFGICNASVTSMQLGQSMRMAHWGPPHMCIMQLIPRVTLLSTGFFDERETYTANLSRLWPATDWAHHMRATLTGLMDNLHSEL